MDLQALEILEEKIQKMATALKNLGQKMKRFSKKRIRAKKRFKS